jgi:hypothetical protein
VNSDWLIGGVIVEGPLKRFTDLGFDESCFGAFSGAVDVAGAA